MRTSAIVALSIAGFGFALWLARAGDPPAPATTIATAGSPAVAQSSARAAVAGDRRSAPSAVEGTAAVRKLDPRSEAFRNRLDERIPTRLYAEAAHCYKGGLQRDQRMDLTYRIRVSQGAVSIGDVRVTESTLGDSSLERCIHDKIVAMRWRDDELPDLEENDDLYMRVAGFSSYLANAEDDDSPSSAMN